MPLSDLIERARQGDVAAIARLLTRSLTDQGVVARGEWQGTELHLVLEGDQPLDPATTVPIIRRGLRRLQLTCPLDQVQVISRQVGHSSSDWQEQFLLEPVGAGDAPLPDPGAVSPPSATDDAPAATDTLLSDQALLTLAQLGPLFGYLTVMTHSLIGFPLAWWGSTFLLPWRIVPPLVVLLARGQESALVRQQSKHALNFQLSMVIYWIVTLALMFVLVGFLFVIPLALLELIAIIIAAVKSAEGKPFRYPLAIPFVQ
jgi:uncharacterized Tic20 family protein